MVQWGKLFLLMLTPCMGVLICISVVLLLIQPPTNESGKAVEDSLRAWALTPTWESGIEFLDSGTSFQLGPELIVGTIWGANQEIENFSSFPSLCHSPFQISK